MCFVNRMESRYLFRIPGLLISFFKNVQIPFLPEATG